MAFYSLLRWKVIVLPILTTSYNYYSLEGWENVFFELGSKSVIPINPFSPEIKKYILLTYYWENVWVR